MGVFHRYGVGDVTSAEAFDLVRPKNYFAAKRGVVYVHGVEAGAGAIDWKNFAGRTALFQGVVDAGYWFLSCDLGGSGTWGNSTVISRITDAKTYLLAQGVLSTKVALLTTSMGTVGGLAWAAANPTLVSCAVSILPVLNLTDVWTNNRGGYTGAINTAYSTYSEATYGAAHSPQTMAAAGSYSGLPIQLWAGNTDAIAVPATASAFQTSVGSGCQLNTITGGHAEATVANVSLASVLSFLAAHA